MSEQSPQPECCRLCPPDKAGSHTTREHVNKLMLAAGTGPSSVPDRVQQALRKSDPKSRWSAIIHPEYPPNKSRVWLAVVSPERGFFVVSLADDVSDDEISTWASDFVTAKT